MDRHRKRHCWECRRLCLVCDFTEPACRRCFLSGIECPGYSDVKPTKFKWLIPGRITSRHRVRKRTASDVMDNNRNEMKTTRTTKLATTKKGLLIPQFEILTEAHIIGQAAQYFNSCIYQDLLPIQELGPNPHIYPISATHLKVAATRPDYLLFGMICMTLSHRINRTRSESSSKALAQKFYLYWGLSVRSLNRRLDVKDGQLDDLVLVSVMTLLLTDVQMGTSLNWRCHLDGLHKMIALRGGYKVLATSWSLEPLLICLWFVAVIANTTCPASDLTMTSSQLDEIEFLQKQYSDAASPFMMCPFTLFAQIIKINHLRMRATACETKEINDLSQEAYNILERIHDFSPEEWANSKFSSKADWLLIGKVYQASIVLYCILSLQSLSVLPTTALLQASCSAHGRHLHLLLDQGLASQKIKRFMIWPLVLLGVQAIHEDLATRAFVSKQLPELSRDVGTYVPLMAKRVLESFWGSGKTDWDACFDRPYVFTTQIAVDTSRCR
ncbi:uncharacterized protein LY89DRAFT_701176 [Mollisia scopiformis]|uniref:Zn(2)-C6 fungal-type domain-containing protein n=1 Tax=Mollisia scopiformis TaxID=149040 RepID=A0A132BB37_MOLSC|nr:uncharacterized protein LY89DRAFT_701176 [Mollisia scopiformis]KUJ09632.1 hypothetical protein LY89DRAFT_701176 [Mollisia scopiformis]